MAYSIDSDRLLDHLTKTVHFILYLLALALYTVHVTGAIPAGSKWGPAVDAMAGILFTLGYGLGAAWNPPRRPWTNEERAARGLSPLPPPSSPPAAAPPSSGTGAPPA